MKKIYKNILALLLGIVFLLIVLEGGTRVVAGFLGLSTYINYNEILGWTAKPGVTKVHKNAYFNFDVTYKINKDGFRGTMYSREKQSDIYRIIILGDSNGFGWGVTENEHFAAIMDDKLNDTEIINLSLGGYGTDQEYLRFIKEGVAFRPDLVIVQVTENDFDEIQFPFFNHKPKPQFLFDERGQLELHNVPVKAIGERAQTTYSYYLPLPFKEWLSWNSYAYYYFNQKYYSIMRERKSIKNQKSGVVKIERYSAQNIHLFNAIIAKLKDKIDEIGAQGVVFHAWEVISKNEYLSETSLPVIDLYPAVSEKSTEHGINTIYQDGVHWTPEGHRIIADELIKVLREEGYLRNKT